MRAILSVLLVACAACAQGPLELRVPFAPGSVRADGKIHLVYELEITNRRNSPVRLSRIEAFSAAGATVAAYTGKELEQALKRKAWTGAVEPGKPATAFLWITVEQQGLVPAGLRHRVTTGDGEVIDGGAVVVDQSSPLVIGAPFRGGTWLVANGPAPEGAHRRALVDVEGQPHLAQRFAIDWMKMCDDLKGFHGNPKRNESWCGYGAEVVAIADGTVSALKDGIPENAGANSHRVVPVTLETVAGNHVILDLGVGRFALYAHLQPGSLRVKPGEHVRRGQVLGLLGNSGNSDAPHLHLHIADANSPLAAEGLPYGFDSFEVLGTIKSQDDYFSHGFKPSSAPLKRTGEIPTLNSVVRFP